MLYQYAWGHSQMTWLDLDSWLHDPQKGSGILLPKIYFGRANASGRHYTQCIIGLRILQLWGWFRALVSDEWTLGHWTAMLPFSNSPLEFHQEPEEVRRRNFNFRPSRLKSEVIIKHSFAFPSASISICSLLSSFWDLRWSPKLLTCYLEILTLPIWRPCHVTMADRES